MPVLRHSAPALAALLLTGPAAAQGLPPGPDAPLAVRVRPEAPPQDIYARAAARGPVVLQIDPYAPRSGAPLVPIRAVPVASVLNGGAFGPTGFGYYGDAVSEGPLNRRQRPAIYYLGSRAY
ncbi:hypothetical protein [Methylobacterium oryzisoli]|uniref:hypothetical protein n=1 Tax=Methylobacterium oryzisoli TaxID=3385502 RepID=UPI003891296D